MERSCRILLLSLFFMGAAFGSLKSAKYILENPTGDDLAELELVDMINSGQWPAFSRPETDTIDTDASLQPPALSALKKQLNQSPRALFETKE